MTEHPLILTLACDGRPGIIAAVTGELVALEGNIVETAQFWDRENNRFFLRIAFLAPERHNLRVVEDRLAPIVQRFGMEAAVTDARHPPRLVVMVSRFDHALLHLLYQVRVGWLHAEIAAIVSNHEDARSAAEHADIFFYYWPVTPATKAEVEARLLALVTGSGAELVVLARYMQVLSADLAHRLGGRVINIHHSFLPSFKGAKPYHQAHARGVKLIGATAHYVTSDLDEGRSSSKRPSA